MPKYLFLRPDSRNWHIRFRYPNKVIEKSLGTPDRRQAEILALPLIAQHKAKLLESRPHLVMRPFTLKPGEYTTENGERVIATERDLIYLDRNSGALIRTEPNSPAPQLMNAPMGAVIHFGNPTRSFAELRRMGPVIDLSKQAPTKNGDDAILETYLKHRNITGYIEREARVMWALFKSLTNKKPLKDCTRDDGRKLVTHLEAQGLKSKTIEKKIAWLNAAVNLAISEGQHKSINPFSAIVPELKDSQRRLPFKDEDMKAIKRNLSRRDKSDQLLVRLLASTGMRISEAFEIEGEDKERGVRYVIVGKKTEQSLRRIPLPAAVLPYLPAKIMGPLFKSNATDASDAASKRLNRFLREGCGITDPCKVVHSFRHRAQDRLRAAECPEDIRWSILGHERETVAAGYGEGFAVPVLKKWIDKIGF